MLDLSSTLRAELNKEVIRCGPLFAFYLHSETLRYWIGEWSLTTGGHTWSGVPVIVGIDFGRMSINGAAENFTVNVSGVSNEFFSRMRAEQSDIIGQRIEIWLQFFNAAWAPLDAPFMVRSGRMLGMDYSRTLQERRFTLRCESKFTARGMPPLSFLSDHDMKVRFPGNRVLEAVGQLQNKTTRWPILVS